MLLHSSVEGRREREKKVEEGLTLSQLAGKVHSLEDLGEALSMFGQLKMLNISITQKQPVITTLLKLHQNGVKDDDIIGLSKIIDLSRMGREWNPLGGNNGQKVGQNMGQNIGHTNPGNGNNGGQKVGFGRYGS